MYTFPNTCEIVEYFIIITVEFFKNNDMLITLLLGLCNSLLQVDIGRFIIFEKMLLSVLYDAVGAKRHETVSITAEVGKEFVRMISTEDLTDLGWLGKSGLSDSRHCR